MNETYRQELVEYSFLQCSFRARRCPVTVFATGAERSVADNALPGDDLRLMTLGAWNSIVLPGQWEFRLRVIKRGDLPRHRAVTRLALRRSVHCELARVRFVVFVTVHTDG